MLKGVNLDIAVWVILYMYINIYVRKYYDQKERQYHKQDSDILVLFEEFIKSYINFFS